MTRAGARAGRGPALQPPSSRWSAEALAAACVVAVLVIPPWLVTSDTKEAFRLVKGLASGWLALLSLVALAWQLRATGADGVGAAWRHPALRALAPLTVVVAAGAISTAHPWHFREAFADFLIGASAAVAWSMGLGAPRLRALLAWTVPPATIVAAIGVLQAIREPGWLGNLTVIAATDRLSLTSTLGNPGDVGVMMVLPTLVAVSRLPSAPMPARAAWAAAAVTMVAAIAVTQTLGALVAVVVGLTTWGLLRAPSRAMTWRAWTVAVVVVVLGLAASPSLRTRVGDKLQSVAAGDVNDLLTGRLDGWRSAMRMLAERPIAGVGHGAFRAHFAETRLALQEAGVVFYPEQHQVMFGTPHNEALSIAAEQGVPGLLALGWAVCVLAATLGRIGDADTRALALASAAALVPLCLVWFPFHVAATAWPWLLWIAWVCREGGAR